MVAWGRWVYLVQMTAPCRQVAGAVAGAFNGATVVVEKVVIIIGGVSDGSCI